MINKTFIFILFLFVFPVFSNNNEKSEEITKKLNEYDTWFHSNSEFDNYKCYIDYKMNGISIDENFSERNKKKQSYIAKKFLDQINKNYKKFFGKFIEEDGINEVISTIFANGNIFDFEAFKSFDKYGYCDRSISGSIKITGTDFLMIKFHNFISATGEVKINLSEAAEKCVMLTNEKARHQYYNYFFDKFSVDEFSKMFLVCLFDSLHINSPFKMREVAQVASHGIWYVSPNKLFKNGDIYYNGYSDTDSRYSDVRLAYEFWVDILVMEKYSQLYHIWIDAENGKFLGGNATIFADVRKGDINFKNAPEDDIAYYKYNKFKRFIYDKSQKKWVEKEFIYIPHKLLYKNGKFINR